MRENVDTVELKDPRREVEGGTVDWDSGDFYRFNETKREVDDSLEDWWSKLDPNADDGPPLTPMEKAMEPHKRNYKTKEEIDAIIKK